MARSPSLARKLGTGLLVLGVTLFVLAFGFSVYVDFSAGCVDDPSGPPCGGDGGSLVWLVFGMVAPVALGFGCLGWALRAYADNAR